MKILLRSAISLLIVLWLGGVMFFPVVAKTAFDQLTKPQAALVVRNCLLTLHAEGLGCGVLLLVLLPVAGAVRVYARPMVGPLLCTAVMLGLTALSQFRVMPRMEADRVAVGGAIDQAAPADARRVEFERLHRASVALEEGVLAAGIGLAVLLARPGRLRPEI